MKRTPDNIWLKASVLGSLWASVEIILGSFFHNLQLPFAGTLLAIFTVVFIIASLQLWKENGIIWRAGLICALMKSISPSAVILGPMTGIFLEALLLELFIFIFGKNLFGYMIAGAMAVLSALMHKFFTLLLIYGWDSVKILANLYRYAMKQIHSEHIKPVDALIVLILVYIMVGVFAAIAGYFIGKQAKKEQLKPSPEKGFDLSKPSRMYELQTKQHYSVLLLFINVAFVIGTLYILNNFGLVYGFLASLLYIAMHASRYKNSFRQFRKPLLWLQFIILILLSTLFYSGSEQPHSFNLSGLLMGLNMVLRAIIVVLGFSAISVELRNPFVKTILYRKGFSQLYNSLGLAFSALPSIIENVSKPKHIFKKPFKTITEILLHTNYLLIIFTENKDVQADHH